MSPGLTGTCPNDMTCERPSAIGARPNGGDDERACAHCGELIDTSEWHPVVGRNDGDEFRIYAFCDDTCRDAWLE